MGVIQLLLAWRANVEMDWSEIDEDLVPSIRSQLAMGMKAFLDGFIIKGWAEYQEKHIRSCNKRGSGIGWMASLLAQLWKMIHSLWITQQDLLHSEETISASLTLKLVNKHITREYIRMKGSHSKQHNYLFKQSLSTILGSKTAIRKRWLETIYIIRERDYKGEEFVKTLTT